MAYGEHETSVSLCNVPWDNRYLDVPYFSNKVVQDQYFSTRGSWYALGDDFRLIDGSTAPATIRVNVNPETASRFNYLCYNNRASGTGKLGWVYCFITGTRAINYECTELTIEVDVIQTYMFSYEHLPCILERRMAQNDSKFFWGEKEGANITQYKTIQGSIIPYTSTSYPYLCVREIALSKTNLTTPSWSKTQINYSKIGSASLPYSFVVCKTDDELASIIKGMQSYPQYNMENIISIGHISSTVCPPYKIIDDSLTGNARTQPYWVYMGSGGTYDTSNQFTPVSFNDLNINITKNIPIPAYITGFVAGTGYASYTPKNKKLLSNEFRTLELDTVGKTITLNLDALSGGFCQLETTVTFDNTFHLFVSPKEYYLSGSRTEYNTYFEIPIAYSLPITTDDYYTWLNAHNVEIQTKKQNIQIAETLGIISAIGSIAMAGVTGGASLTGLTVGASALTQGALQTRELEKQNEQVRSQDSYTERGEITDNFMQMSGNLQPQYVIRQIDPREVVKWDTFLSRYGYKTNEMGIPNFHARENWDYIKTNNCNIKPSGNYFMNNEVKNKIQNIYDSGIRFWHNPSYIGDYAHYSYDNPVYVPPVERTETDEQT